MRHSDEQPSLASIINHYAVTGAYVSLDVSVDDDLSRVYIGDFRLRQVHNMLGTAWPGWGKAYAMTAQNFRKGQSVSIRGRTILLSA